MSKLKKILIIEDDKTISDELKILLDDNGYDSYQLFNFHQQVQKPYHIHFQITILNMLVNLSKTIYFTLKIGTS